MAKKSKGFNELLRQKQQEENQSAALKKLEERVQGGAFKNNVKGVLKNPTGQEKMSDVLEAFVEPYLEDAETFELQRKLFTIAIVAWNVAIMPDDQQPAAIEKFVQPMARGDQQIKQDVRGILAELIERKNRFFANNKRYIVDFELKKIGKTHHLSVASTLADDFKAE